MIYYTVWRAKTEEVAASGTAEECARTLGRSRSSFYCLVSRVRSGKLRKWLVYAERDGKGEGYEDGA